MQGGDTSVEYSIPRGNRVDLSNAKQVNNMLYKQLDEWKSVKYKIGGLSKSGIDCSGFVYVTFLNRFGIKLPRTTELQSKLGDDIAKSRLRAGDLIFFKTGTKVRHVAIYLGNGEFIHASTSRGVMISSLDNKYWSKKYWKSIRIKT
jgi:cell wall-associated NlpC family hydrolase